MFKSKIEALKSKVLIDDIEYYSKLDFAIIIEKYPAAVSKLINKGNKFRRLKAIRLGNRVYIQASELLDFPHCPKGKPGQGENVTPYFYDAEGNVIPNKI